MTKDIRCDIIKMMKSSGGGSADKMFTKEEKRLSTEFMAEKVMKVTDFVIADAKIEGFCLRPDSKHYSDFAFVGYTKKDGDRLRSDLIEAFKKGKRTDIRSGDRDGDICFNIYTDLGISRRRFFCTGWQIDNGDNKARFITAFDKKRGEK